MIRILWEFRVAAGRKAEFVRVYGPEGAWAELFRRDPAFLEVVLLRDADDERRFVTLDIWRDLDGFRAFRERFVDDYAALDAACAALTESETHLGVFVDA